MRLIVNGASHEVAAPDHERLLTTLRERLHLTGTAPPSARLFHDVMPAPTGQLQHPNVDVRKHRSRRMTHVSLHTSTHPGFWVEQDVKCADEVLARKLCEGLIA